MSVSIAKQAISRVTKKTGLQFLFSSSGLRLQMPNSKCTLIPRYTAALYTVFRYNGLIELRPKIFLLNGQHFFFIDVSTTVNISNENSVTFGVRYYFMNKYTSVLVMYHFIFDLIGFIGICIKIIDSFSLYGQSWYTFNRNYFFLIQLDHLFPFFHSIYMLPEGFKIHSMVSWYFIDSRVI